MYARVAAFESRDMSLADELIGEVRERARSGHDLPDARRFLMLIDREAGTALGLTFFESEDAIRRAEAGVDRMADEIPAEKRGRRTSVDVYEVAIEDVGEGARAARVSSLEGRPDKIDEGIRFIKEQILPEAHNLTGWTGVGAPAARAAGAAQ